MGRFARVSQALLLFVSLVFSGAVSAQILIDDPTAQPPKRKVGQAAAAEYFKEREKARSGGDDREVAAAKGGGGEHALALHVGTFVNDKAYRWGTKDRVDDPGQLQLGVTYRIGEWKSSMDLFFRAEIMSYEIDDERPVKLSVMPIIAFPDARSTFPLYFGAGAGAGIFFRQVGDESDLSLDYTLIIGARFPNMFQNGGLVFETGLKGQVNLLSSGQHDGVFLSAGYMFSF